MVFPPRNAFYPPCDMTLVESSTAFAHEAHDLIGQKRKFTSEPYWVHTDDVREIAASIGCDDEVLAACNLHDYREDVVTFLTAAGRLAELEVLEARYRQFPQRVRDLVVELTDVYVTKAFPNLNRAERKRLECERLGGISGDGKTIKCCDLLSNSRSLFEYDQGFGRTYLREKLALIPHLAGAHPVILDQVRREAVLEANKVGMRIPFLKT